MADGLDIAFFGSSLVSSWWNGSCTYYRGIIRGLHGHGHRVTFYEPLAYQRQEHRDIDDPDWAEVVIYPAPDAEAVRAVVERARGADVVVKTSGVGVFDDVLEEAVAALGDEAVTTTAFWDVDAPATLGRMEDDPGDSFRSVLPAYDLVLTYGGGRPVIDRYDALGARECIVVYNALDPSTHHRVAPDERFRADHALLANRLPDREERVDEFFFRAAALLPHRTFLLGGNGWDKAMPPNVRAIGHVGTEDHNAFNCTPTSVLNVTRQSMAANGWSPATRVFEAAGAGACLVTDAWDGIEEFLAPATEVLVAADGADVAAHVEALTAERAAGIGRRAAERVQREHTYERRAADVDAILRARARAVAGSTTP